MSRHEAVSRRCAIDTNAPSGHSVPMGFPRSLALPGWLVGSRVCLHTSDRSSRKSARVHPRRRPAAAFSRPSRGCDLAKATFRRRRRRPPDDTLTTRRRERKREREKEIDKRRLQLCSGGLAWVAGTSLRARVASAFNRRRRTLNSHRRTIARRHVGHAEVISLPLEIILRETKFKRRNGSADAAAKIAATRETAKGGEKGCRRRVGNGISRDYYSFSLDT